MEKKRKQRVYLSEEDKMELAEMARDRSIPYSEIAKTYNVCEVTVSRAARAFGVKRSAKGKHKQPRKKPTTTPEKQTKTESDENITLLEHLEERNINIAEELKKWEAIKHEACHTLDRLRLKQQEYFIALQALKRAKEANNKLGLKQ